MRKITQDQTGLAHLGAALLVALVIGVVGYVGYTVANKSGKKQNASQTTSETESSESVSISVLKEGERILGDGVADPTIAKTDSGYRLYVNRQTGSPTGYMTYISSDGVNWTKENDSVIPSAATGRAVAMDDGIRFYYPGMQPINPSDPPANMFSTFSANGVNFTKDAGVRLEPQSGAYYLEGPTVFQLADKTWRMYFNENSITAGNQRDGIIWGASSTDGLSWTRDSQPTIESGAEEAKLNQPWKQVLHPFVLANPKGGYLMLYNSHSEVFAATSDDGKTWDKLGDIGVHGADVDGYFQEDGTLRIYYGDHSEQTGGIIYTAVLKVD